ncbi:MAG: hypothetical protein IJX22_04410, partial [Opitutales bacterium]|nr:hypothetical protein [Opitutales bacterium]
MSESFENAEPYSAPAPKPRGNVATHPRQPKQTASTPEDRVPPHNVEAEQAILAAIIIDDGGDILNTCIEKKVTPEYFFKTEHQIIYDACLKLSAANTVIDEITLKNFLEDRGSLGIAGGFIYINDLTARIE